MKVVYLNILVTIVYILPLLLVFWERILPNRECSIDRLILSLSQCSYTPSPITVTLFTKSFLALMYFMLASDCHDSIHY